jgi:hypothetical protein
LTHILFPKNVINQSEKDAESNAGCQWKVKREVAAPDLDISRQPAQVKERKESRIIQQQARYEKNNAQNDQQPT